MTNEFIFAKQNMHTLRLWYDSLFVYIYIYIGKTNIRYRGAVICNNVPKSKMKLNESELSFVKQFKTQIMAGSINDKVIVYNNKTLHMHNHSVDNCWNACANTSVVLQVCFG